jgi:magnesium transporter
VQDVLDDFRKNAALYADRDVQYTYVLSAGGALRGVLRLRDLVLSRRDRPVADLMIPDPVSVDVDAGLDVLGKVFEGSRFLGLPVVDGSGVMRGVVSRAAVNEAQAEHSTDDFLAASGIVGGEELRSMPMLTRCFRRLSWLTPNIGLNIIAASIIAMYESTIQSVIALAVFLPIISDMSGCSGNQAVAVSMRELTLGLIRPAEYMRVIWKEGILGLINGLVLGLLLGTLAVLWKGNIWLGVVIGGALAVNTLLSVLLGGLVPLLMKRLRVDPALASGPLLTTCTDMCGFLLVLTLATSLIDKIV